MTLLPPGRFLASESNSRLMAVSFCLEKKNGILLNFISGGVRYLRGIRANFKEVDPLWTISGDAKIR